MTHQRSQAAACGVRRSSVSLVVTCTDVAAVRNLRRIDDPPTKSGTCGHADVVAVRILRRIDDRTNGVRNLRRTDVVAVCDSCYIILYHSMLMWWPSVILTVI